MEPIDIQKALDGEAIFITGFTGFLGKVLTEKLLRCCPGIKHIYILIREKKGKRINERLEEVLKDPLFSVLERENPKFRKRLTALAGDCSLPDLGLCHQDRELVINEVGVIFHGAATVRFDEPLKVAYMVNVKGTKELINLAKNVKDLKVFVHVSTAYANCHLNKIEEKVYDPPMEAQKLENIVTSMDDDVLLELQPRLLGKWPNTYAMTKAIAEHVVMDLGHDLSRVIFRPAIVVGTYTDPISGWTDNLYGPTGIVVGAGVGLLHSLYCDLDIVANIIPVDYAVSGLIATAAKQIQDKPPKDEVPVYNYVSSLDNPLKWGDFKGYVERHGEAVPTTKAMWCYFLTTHKIWIFHFLCTIFLHYLPALLLDTVTTISRSNNPKLIKIYRKIDKYSKVLSYFSVRQWDFTNENVKNLYSRLTLKDQKLFQFDIKTLNWDTFFYNYIRGLRVYLVKDNMDTLPEAKIRYKRFLIAHQVVKIVFFYCLFRVVYMIASPLLSWAIA